MRLILDTNVLVSANIQRSYPYFIVDRVFADSGIELCISEELFAEYVEVLNRKKFARFLDFHARAQTLLNDIDTYGIMFTPIIKVDLIRDGPDNRLRTRRLSGHPVRRQKQRLSRGNRIKKRRVGGWVLMV